MTAQISNKAFRIGADPMLVEQAAGRAERIVTRRR